MPRCVGGDMHEWPTAGHYTIQKCERECGYCGFAPEPNGCDSSNDNEYLTALRRHVRYEHVGKPGCCTSVGTTFTWTGWAEFEIEWPKNRKAKTTTKSEHKAQKRVYSPPPPPSTAAEALIALDSPGKPSGRRAIKTTKKSAKETSTSTPRRRRQPPQCPRMVFPTVHEASDDSEPDMTDFLRAVKAERQQDESNTDAKAGDKRLASDDSDVEFLREQPKRARVLG